MKMAKTMRWVGLFCTALLFAGCGTEAEQGDEFELPRASSTVLSGDRGKGDQLDIPVTFEEFLEHVYCRLNGRVCITDGDTPIAGGMEGLREFYEQRVVPRGQALSVNWGTRGDDLWYGDQRFDLSFCVSSDFGDRKQEVVDAMLGAAADWEEHAAVKFVYKPEQDHRCDTNNRQVLFPVIKVDDPWATYLASAFFPYYEPEDRLVDVNMPAIDESMAENTGAPDDMTLRGIMRHELGHVLGFRHEHTRDEAGAYYCFEDRHYRPGTLYDSKSVMHYPQCGGDNDWSLQLSEQDKIGAAYFYPEAGVAVMGRCDEELNADGTVNEDCEFVVRQIAMWLSQYGTENVVVNWMGLSEELSFQIGTESMQQPFSDLDELRERTDITDEEIRQIYDYLFVDGRCPDTEIDEQGWLVPWCYPVLNKILELANNATFEELNDGVGLDIRAVENIVAARSKRPLDTYDALVSLGYVKRVALYTMYRYLYPE